MNRTLQWGLLIGLSAAVSALLLWLTIPAALLLGPIVAGILVTTHGGGRVAVPNQPFVLAQGLIGCMVAKMLPLSVASEVAGRWPVFVAGALSVIAASALLGLVLSRMKILPGSTALWGLSPGGATTMVLMAEAHGADAQLVAFMQYLRVVIVAAVASLVARCAGLHVAHAAAVQAVVWFPPIAWVPLIETIALAVLGAVLGNVLRLQAGALLIPLVAGIVLTRLGLISIELPRWLLTLAYAVVGWRIGLRFTRPLLVHAAKALPRVLVCTLVLVGFCAALGALLVLIVGIDPLTAYLATSPGGADSVAIIAASSKVDASFVMAMQMARLVAVLALGPPMTRFFAAQADV